MGTGWHVLISLYNAVCVFYSDEVREKMKLRYLSNPDYNFEKVNRASMACGPMVKWAIAQVTECDIAIDCKKGAWGGIVVECVSRSTVLHNCVY
jgi:hypothetical protein